MEISANFEKYINEIQFLRKQVSGEKLAHQNTLKQLQSAYEIIDEIKDALRIEQNSNTKLKAQLSETALNLNTVAHQYEAQIGEIKDLLTVKDEELRRINSYLRVNDADIIRMKVINELQLEHAEKIERLNAEIVRKAAEVTELRTTCASLLDKHEHLQREMQAQREEAEEKIEEVNQKYMGELKSTFELLERERSEHNKWAKKHQMLQQRLNKQTELYKAEIHKLTQELESENKSLLSSNEAKLNKHKVEKLEDVLMKVKQELADEKESNARLEDELARLRKECKNYKRSEHDLILDKERSLEEIEQLKRDLAYKDAQHKKNIETIHKEMENKVDNASLSTKDDRDQIHRLQAELSKITFRLQQLQNQNQILREQNADKNLATMKKELSEKEDEIEALREEARALKKRQDAAKREGERKRTVSMQEKQEGAEHLKRKLQEANAKIVQLLKEKIQLKKEISTLQGR